jgi:glutathione S-transferase
LRKKSLTAAVLQVIYANWYKTQARLPWTCTSRLYEAGSAANFIEVDPKTKRTLDGADYFAVNPLGLVPAIRIDGGEVLTENAAILQYIADMAPAARLAASGGMARSRLQ